MPTLSSLTVNLRGDSSSLVKASRSGLKAIKGLRDGVAGTVLKVGALAGAVSGLVGAAGLVGLARQSSESVDKVGKLSTQLGITGTEVQKLELVAELSGVSIETLSKAFQRTTRLAGDFQAGGKEASETFKRLGISLAEVRKASPVELFQRVISRLGEITSKSKQASIGNKLFAEQWQTLGPLIEGFNAAFRRAGIVFDDLKFGIGDGAKAVENLNDNLTVGQKALTAFRNLVFAKLAPDLDTLVIKLGRMAEAWVRSAGGADQLADVVVGKLRAALPQIVGWARDVKASIDELRISIEGVGAAYQAVGDFLGRSAVGAQGVLTGDVNKINAAFPGAAAQAEGVAAEKSVKELEQINDTLRDIKNNGPGLVFG